MKMRRITSALCSVAFVAMAGRADAQAGRYTMEKTEEGYVRMDTQTGEISICNAKGDQIVCKMAADERAAFHDDLAALEDRVTALEERVNSGAMPPSADSGLPTEEEFEKGLSYMERFFRRFMGVAKEFEDNPDKT